MGLKVTITIKHKPKREEEEVVAAEEEEEEEEEEGKEPRWVMGRQGDREIGRKGMEGG